MNNVITTGHKNNRPSTKSFLTWLRKINVERNKILSGIDKFIMRVERNDDVISIATFNGSIYTISYSEQTYNDLNDLVAYCVMF